MVRHTNGLAKVKGDTKPFRDHQVKQELMLELNPICKINNINLAHAMFRPTIVYLKIIYI